MGEALANPEEATEMVRSLLTLVLTPDDGQLRVDLAGELAAIFSIAEERRRQSCGERGPCIASNTGCGGPQQQYRMPEPSRIPVLAA